MVVIVLVLFLLGVIALNCVVCVGLEEIYRRFPWLRRESLAKVYPQSGCEKLALSISQAKVKEPTPKPKPKAAPKSGNTPKPPKVPPVRPPADQPPVVWGSRTAEEEELRKRVANVLTTAVGTGALSFALTATEGGDSEEAVSGSRAAAEARAAQAVEDEDLRATCLNVLTTAVGTDALSTALEKTCFLSEECPAVQPPPSSPPSDAAVGPPPLDSPLLGGAPLASSGSGVPESSPRESLTAILDAFDAPPEPAVGAVPYKSAAGGDGEESAAPTVEDILRDLGEAAGDVGKDASVSGSEESSEVSDYQESEVSLD